MPDIPAPALWAGFVVLILGLVAFDRWMSDRRHAPLTLAKAVRWSCLWVGLSVLFGLGVILVVIGAKMCLTDLIHVPALLSFALTVGILLATVLLSIFPHGRGRPVDV